MRLQSSGISLKVKFFKVRHKTLGREIICTEMLVWAGSILDRSDKELLAEFYRHLAEGPTAQNRRIGGDTALFIVLQDLREFLSCKQTRDEVVGVVQKVD